MTPTPGAAPAAPPDTVSVGRSRTPSLGSKREHRRHEQAAHQAVSANSSHLRFTVGDTRVDLTLPPVEKLAFYAVLGGAAVLGVIEWPIALLTGLGHLLTDDRRNRTLRALGVALDAA